MAEQESRSSFSLYAELALEVGTSCRVSGDVGVRSVGRASSGAQLVLGSHTVLGASFRAIAPSVQIASGAQCATVLTDELIDHNSADRPATSAFPAALMPPLPLVVSAGAGERAVVVAAGQQQTLTPGAYGSLVVDGVAVLEAGEYGFTDVTVGADAELRCAGAVQVTVLRTLTAHDGARLRPQDVEMGATDMHVSVLAADDETTPAVRLGQRVVVRAVVAAPHATVALGAHAELTGAVAGFRIDVADHVTVHYERGLPGVATDPHGVQVLEPGAGGPFGLPFHPVVGTVPYDRLIGLGVGLPTRDPAGLQEFIRAVSDPRDPQYRKHLTQEQFRATYGALDADYAEVQSWADMSGLTTLNTHRSNLLLTVRGTANQVQQAVFCNLLLRERPDGTTYPVADRAISVDLRLKLLEVAGLGDWGRVGTNGPTGTGWLHSFTGPDLRRAYLGTTPSAYQQLLGVGQTVGICGWEDYRDIDVDTYAISVQTGQGLPPVPPPPQQDVQIVYRASDDPFVPGSTEKSVEEAVLDVDMVYAMAPGAAIRFFKAGQSIYGINDCLHAMANYEPLTVASCSLWWETASFNSQCALDQMAALGVTFAMASGDTGGANWVPCSYTMNNMTLVGGTVLTCNRLFKTGPPVTYPIPYYQSESGWSKSGGGVMHYEAPENLNLPQLVFSVSIPDYQVAIMTQAAASNGGSVRYRNYPDVAMVAQDLEEFTHGIADFGGGGTSVAAPLFAGFVALINEYSLHGANGLMGFINPVLYSIGETAGPKESLYSYCFNDITTGSNPCTSTVLLGPIPLPAGSTYYAVPGYDLVTGLGSPKPAIIFQLGNPQAPSTPLTNIHLSIGTGEDNLRGDSQALARVHLPDATVVTFVLKDHDEPEWDAGSSHDRYFELPNLDPPLTEQQGITGVVLQLVAGDGGVFASADNWDVGTLQVGLFNPGTEEVCQLNLVGQVHLQDGSFGLVRLGPDGVGPSSPMYATGPGSGCPQPA